LFLSTKKIQQSTKRMDFPFLKQISRTFPVWFVNKFSNICIRLRNHDMHPVWTRRSYQINSVWRFLFF
jgi:hypothetical protein